MGETTGGISARSASSSFKLWTRLGTASVAGLAAASMSLAAVPSALAGGAVAGSLNLAQGEGGEGGEAAQIAKQGGSDDVNFLTLLGLVEGHIRVGTALYDRGAADMAKVHISHPAMELYEDLAPALAKRNVKGFADPLDKLVSLVEEEGPVAEFDAACQSMLQKIAEARASTGSDLVKTLKSIVALVRTAAEEYEVGVKDGKVAEPREYQDAWGFTHAAAAQLAALPEADRKRMGEAYGTIAKELDALSPAWPSVVPPETVAADATLIQAAAARIELAVLTVK